jgi:hypothetical protein
MGTVTRFPDRLMRNFEPLSLQASALEPTVASLRRVAVLAPGRLQSPRADHPDRFAGVYLDPASVHIALSDGWTKVNLLLRPRPGELKLDRKSEWRIGCTSILTVPVEIS